MSRANKHPKPDFYDRKGLKRTKRFAIHDHNPAGTKLLRLASEHRLTKR